MSTSIFSDYTVSISTDPSYYGSECTAADADRIASSLANLIKSEFPGISVTASGRPVSGPDSETCDEIRQWVESNWTAAL